MCLLCKIMCFRATVIFILLFGLIASQNDTVTEEILTNDVSDVICKKCSCNPEIGKVDCSYCDLREPFEFKDWNGLKLLNPIDVDVSFNKLSSFTRMSELPIQKLNLSNCEIETLDDACFSFLTELTTLDLSNNLLSTNSLTKRVFMGRMLTFARPPEMFAQMRYLSLAYNEIYSLPQDIFTFMSDLTFLDLSNNPLTYIDQVTMAAITDLTKLKELRLSGCELEALPDGLFRRQRRLERLDLSNNRFATVPSAIGEAANLISLNFGKNPFITLESNNAITKLSKLQELYLCRNSKLQTIEAGALGQLEKLVKLRICFNPRLTNIDPGFLTWIDEHETELTPMLKEFYLNNNNISFVNPDFLDGWDQLRSVDFAGNPYVCDCSSQWMVNVLVNLMESVEGNGTAEHMLCKKPPEMRGMTFLKLHINSMTLVCPETAQELSKGGPDVAVVLGIMIGIMATFPIVLIAVLLWKKGYFAKCRGQPVKDHTEEETDAF